MVLPQALARQMWGTGKVKLASILWYLWLCDNGDQQSTSNCQEMQTTL